MCEINKENTTDILIIGAGSTGLGSAWRLQELLERNRLNKKFKWMLIDQSEQAGGAAVSHTDELGFTWDVGSHVIYSRYKYFDNVLNKTMGDNLLSIERKGWVWMKNRFIPYPLQNNLQLLPPNYVIDCISNYIAKNNTEIESYNNFEDYVKKNYGQLLAEEFFLPYIYKMFAYPAEDLTADWVNLASGSKYKNVSQIDIPLLLDNILRKKDSPGWENGNHFPYPKIGGSGKIWESICKQLPDQNMILGDELKDLDVDRKVAIFSSGRCVKYDFIISTIPLPEILKLCDYSEAPSLLCTRAHVVGFGFRGDKPSVFSDKMWVYDATENSPYFRLSFPHNYSNHNVPDDGEHWSVLCEVSESDKKIVKRDKLKEDVLSSLERDFSIDRDKLVSTFYKSTNYAYAVPSHGRDEQLKQCDEWLTKRGVFSRGRFGNWKYECGNQDSSFMQGVEAVDKILFGIEEITHLQPELINENLIDRTLSYT